MMAQAVGKTKGELATLIKSTIPSDKRTNRTVGKLSKGKEITEQIYNRIKLVRKRTEMLEEPDVLNRLTKIDLLLQEIESLGE